MKGFQTFRDEKKLDKGEDVDIGLLNAIKDSRVPSLVFSKGYVTSRSCWKSWNAGRNSIILFYPFFMRLSHLIYECKREASKIGFSRSSSFKNKLTGI